MEKMDVVKKKGNKEKLQTSSNDSLNVAGSSKRKETLLGIKGDGKDPSDHKRKSLEVNASTVIRAKQSKQEEVGVASGNINSSNNVKNVQRLTVSAKDSGMKYEQGKKKEKMGSKVKESDDVRKRKTPDKSDQPQKPSKTKPPASDKIIKKQESGPSPPKMKKVDKEGKNITSRKSSTVGMKSKSTPGKTVKKSKKVTESSADIVKLNEDDPMSMLMMMEGGKGKQLGVLSSASSSSTSLNMPATDKEDLIVGNRDEMMDSDDSDWEDVKDHTLPVLQGEHSQVPTDPVQITLEMPDDPNTKKRKKREFDMKKHLEKMVRKFNREVATNIHKSHILCLLAHGLRQNSILNNETVQGICLSLLPPHLSYLSRASYNSEKLVESAMAWYRSIFPIKRITHTSGSKLISVNSIVSVLSSKTISDARMWVYVFVIVLRTLQLSVRLVLSLQPIPFKVPESSVVDPSTSSSKAQWTSKSSKTESKPPPPAPQKATAKYSSDIKLKVAGANNRKQELKIKSNRKILSESEDDDARGKSNSNSSLASRKKSRAPSKSSRKSSSSSSRMNISPPLSSSSKETSLSTQDRPSGMRPRRESMMKAKKNLKEESDDSDFDEKSGKLEKKSNSKKGNSDDEEYDGISDKLSTKSESSEGKSEDEDFDDKSNKPDEKSENKKENSDDEDFDDESNLLYNKSKSKKIKSDDEEYDEKSDKPNKKAKSKRGKNIAKSGKVNKKLKNKKEKETAEDKEQNSDEGENSDSDGDVANTFRGKYELKIKSNRKIVSDDEDEEPRAHDFWLEIFSSSKKRWTSAAEMTLTCVSSAVKHLKTNNFMDRKCSVCNDGFDCFKIIFDKPYVLEKRATQPISYVVAFRNDNGVKDVTPRYAKQWLSLTRKIRVDADWLEQTFSMFGKATYQETIEEEDHIKGQLMVRPMPATVGEFKNHPFYALRRHLLKFEAIYPETAIPLGYIKKEPVYARECVRTLRSKQHWLKEGRLVRLKEEPYKMGKSRPSMRQPKQNPEELDLELFGEWQTEKFIPLPAFNGKIPKNDYGNVEIFKPWMLPGGTVQLRLQGLQKVAKKLNIDVAPAMVGWDHHGGRAHPIFDGCVVCEEHVDALLEAWDEDQEIQQQKEDEKREKRVYGNWRLLIRGMLIKERLKNKFLKEAPALLDDESMQESAGPSKPTTGSSVKPEIKPATDVQEKNTHIDTKKKMKKKKMNVISDDTDDSD